MSRIGKTNTTSPGRAISVHQLLSTEPRTMPFTGAWQALVGNPERTGSWIAWGRSGNGKTRFALQLGKYLTNFGKVAYNSLEEGASVAMRKAFMETGMQDAGRKLVLLDKEPIEELQDRLRRHKSPEIIVIDSLQYTAMTYAQYKELNQEFRQKLFVYVSHAEGREPAGRVAKSIRFDANVKIFIEGYMAYAVSRYGGGHPYTIWEHGASQYQASITG
jgi:hypothetical protein